MPSFAFSGGIFGFIRKIEYLSRVIAAAHRDGFVIFNDEARIGHALADFSEDEDSNNSYG